MADNLERLRKREAEAAERVQEAQRRYNDATAHRDERKREIKALRSERQRVEEQAEAEALVPGRASNPTAVKARVRKEVEELDEEIREAETLIERRAEEKEQALKEHREVCRKLALRYAREVAEKEEQRVEALDRMFEAVREAYVDYLDTAEDRDEAIRQMRRFASAASTSPTQKKKLSLWLEEQQGVLPAGALVGRLLADVLAWARRISNGPIPDMLTNGGIPPRDGSPRHYPAVGAREEVLAWLEDGRLPDRPKL